jgi:AraC-like DNA-binding protein
LNVSDIIDSSHQGEVEGPVSLYREVAPPPPLRPFVECLWIRAVKRSDAPNERRILPDGRMDLVWISERGVLVAGPQTQFTERPDVLPLLAVGTRFYPGVAPGLLRLPASDFIDGHVELDLVDPQLAARVEARLSRARNVRQALGAMAAELVRRIDDISTPDPALQKAIVMLDRGSIGIAEIGRRVFLSERQLRRQFIERVGYGPKTLQRVLRFQRLASLLRSGHTSLAGVAAAAGYADQAHLSRECRQLAGVTPAELVKRLD